MALQLLWRGEADYERVRTGGVWNARKPDRFPDVIPIPATDGEVVEAVRLARSSGLQLAVRSGGHSMAGSGVRDDGMLIDLSRLQDIAVDAPSLRASVQPAVRSRELAHALGQFGLAFPVGHCGSVALGGYLLSGGLGWNMGSWGPASALLSAGP